MGAGARPGSPGQQLGDAVGGVVDDGNGFFVVHPLGPENREGADVFRAPLIIAGDEAAVRNNFA